ncbi:MAG: ferrous iron transport protein A [Thermoplasmata archaeon]|nr:ferrous iron transport protein A [Thermoplasmata archaeon]
MAELRPENTLAQVEPGTNVKVIHVKGKGAARRRIFDMGIVPGAEVKVIRKAPMGDPIEFKVKGYNLTMRKTEAELVVVDVLGRGE